jgi:high-affinity K+ transport system ATPase subunit B
MSVTMTPRPEKTEHATVKARPLFDSPIVRRAIRDSFVKLNPLTLLRNPVIFVVRSSRSS